MKRAKGDVISVGTMLGYEYAVKTLPHVPRQYGNNALYPVIKMKQSLLHYLICDSGACCLPIKGEDVEVGSFEHGFIVVNHRSYPFKMGEQGIVLGARDTVWIKKAGILP